MSSAVKQVSVLVIDDDEDVLVSAEILLNRHFSEVVTVSDPNKIASLMEQHTFQVFLLDMNFKIGSNSGAEGLKWLKRIKRHNPTAVVILITAYGDIRKAVESIKFGATDYILKPWSNEALVQSINSGLKLFENKFNQSHGDTTENELLASDQTEIIYRSDAMREVLKTTDRVASTDASILITGENGTGKGLLARYIHRASKRADAPFVSVDLSTLSEALIESELFGHKKGAFTDAHSDRDGYFVSASGGTLFLDEIGNIPLGIQVKLLRVLEERKITPVGSNQELVVDVRVVTATNMPLQEMVDAGTFRRDLFYRLNTLHMHVPELRERADDIEVLVGYFLNKMCRKYDRAPKSISAEVLRDLMSYSWPGNIRELAHAVERAVILADGEEFSTSDFIQEQVKSSVRVLDDSEDLGLTRIEIETIERALKKFDGNISNAADALKITRTSLYRRIKKYDL